MATTTNTASLSAQSPLSENNPSSISPNDGAQSGALSPGGVSQTSQNAGTTSTSVGNSALTNGGTNSTCCENGRPIMTDPVSGQTVCSCQYDSARLALSGYTRLPSASVYGTPYPSTDSNPYPSIGVDTSAFYSPLVSSNFYIYLKHLNIISEKNTHRFRVVQNSINWARYKCYCTLHTNTQNTFMRE